MKILAGKWTAADAAEVLAVELVTAANKTSILAKAGWGLVGGALLGPIGVLAGIVGGGSKSVHIIAVRASVNEALLQVSFAEYTALIKQIAEGQVRRKEEQSQRELAAKRSSRALLAYESKLSRLEEDFQVKRITEREYEHRLAEAQNALSEGRV